MQRRCGHRRTIAAALLLTLAACTVEEEACPTGFDFAPAAGEPGSTAVAMSDNRIVGWATEVVSLAIGESVDEEWMDPQQALGPAEGTPGNVLALGRGGHVVLLFDPPITDGDGADLAVFENSLNDDFLELAFVEVSSDGETFARFPSFYKGTEAVAAYAGHDPTWISGLAGKYRGGFGTPFDLADLDCTPEVVDGRIDTAAIAFVRIVDIIGDGQTLDGSGRPIYDPYPTVGSAGFDLDAVAAMHVAE